MLFLFTRYMLNSLRIMVSNWTDFMNCKETIRISMKYCLISGEAFLKISLKILVSDSTA